MALILSYYFSRGGNLQENTKNIIFTLKKGKKIIFWDIGKNKLLLKNINYES